MGFPEMPAALASKRVDAAFVTEPSVTSAVKRGGARILAKPYDSIATQFTISAWFTTVAWAKANPGLVKRIAGVFRQSSAWANTHDAETAQQLSAITKLPIEVVNQMVRSRFADSLTVKNFQPIIDCAAKYGYISKAFPAGDIIDPNAV
jgi:NitT/TauT family transport system substrate-binding protein